MAPGPFARLAVSGEDEILAALRAAVAVGASDPLCGDEAGDPGESPVRSMALATVRLVDVALAAQVAQTHPPDDAGHPDQVFLRDVAHTLRTALAGAIGLTWHALRLHGGRTGYDVASWESEAAYGAQAVLLAAVDPEPTQLAPTPLREARDAGRALADALAAAEGDRMAVPGYLAEALGHQLALWFYAAALLRH